MVGKRCQLMYSGPFSEKECSKILRRNVELADSSAVNESVLLLCKPLSRPKVVVV